MGDSSSSTTAHSYDGILRDLCERTQETPNNSLKEILESFGDCRMQLDSTESNSNDALPFRPGGLTDLLAAKLLLAENEDESKDENNNCNYLVVAQSLVTSLPSVYLPALAKSVSDLAILSKRSISFPKMAQDEFALLRLWVSLVTNGTTPLGVHDLLSNALLVVLKKQQDASTLSLSIEKEMTDLLVADWKTHLHNGKDKIAAVRCAAFLVRCISLLGDKGLAVAKASGGDVLLLQMIKDFDDPLQQLSLLDALIDEFDTDSENTNNTNGVEIASSVQEWLSSPEIMSLVLQLLKDPLLEDAALRYIGMLSAVKPQELSIIFDHIRTIERPPSRDSDRLPLVRSISRAASASEEALSTILSDPHLRNTWWSFRGISQPKLQAAIFVSVARVLPEIPDSSMAIRVYQYLGSDNSSSSTTTQWLLDKFAGSPIVEARIAAHALLAVMLRIPTAGLLLLGAEPQTTQDLIENVLLKDLPSSATTKDSQTARFDLLLAFLEASETAPILIPNTKAKERLLKKKSLGPHGKEVRSYGADDIAIC